MRKLTKRFLLAGLMLTLSSTAFADPRGHYGSYSRYGNYYQPHHYSSGRTHIYNSYRGSNAVDVLIPLAIGGVIGYALNNSNNPPQSPPVIVQQPAPQIIQQIVDPSTSSASSYHYENVYMESCACTRRVLVRD
jgi:hypothetical protein